MKQIKEVSGATKFLIEEFDRVYNDAIEKFLEKTKEYFEKNREDIIKKRILSIHERINPMTLGMDINIYFENIKN